MYIRLDIWSWVPAPGCSLAIIHEWKIVIHHHVDLQYIYSAGDDVCRNQDFLSALPEPIDDRIALATFLRTMERSDLVTLGTHTLCYTVRCTSLLAEDNALADGKEVIKRDEDVVFVFLALAVHVELPDRVDCQLVPFQLDLVRIRRELRGEVAYMVWEGGGEKDNLRLSVPREHTIARIRLWLTGRLLTRTF
jgi:hypothetical protein